MKRFLVGLFLGLSVLAAGAQSLGPQVISFPLSCAQGGAGQANGAWTSYTPSVAPLAGAFAIAPTVIGAYQTNCKTTSVRVRVNFAAASIGTATGGLQVGLPNSIGVAQVASGTNLANANTLTVSLGAAAANTMNVYLYNGAYPAGDSQSILINSTYENL